MPSVLSHVRRVDQATLPKSGMGLGAELPNHSTGAGRACCPLILGDRGPGLIMQQGHHNASQEPLVLLFLDLRAAGAKDEQGVQPNWEKKTGQERKGKGELKRR